ncbi:hypothetical protein QEJ31_05070 [Pigmentibacter sp. JX0631]|uniref:hypothetical protein n=1 Tax=Pigmentibacter sp. JX0631 TaxID=2976982 RepID=UPI0024684B93|nr:hypothetical protein [Pigmentibacter sp. JX0631]WGL60968.1 hypothetical protein QEJ31_05070 [Pigmentibacter sp. JX0631]
MSKMLKIVTGSLLVIALASTGCKKGGEKQHNTEELQVKTYKELTVNFSNNQVNNSDYEITTQVKCMRKDNSVVELKRQTITKIYNTIAYFSDEDYNCNILVTQIILKKEIENKIFKGDFSIVLSKGKSSSAQFNSDPAGNTRYLYGKIGENLQTLSLELHEAQFAEGRFEIDPKTGLPKIDDDTGKPKLKNPDVTNVNKIIVGKQLAVTFNNLPAPEAFDINYKIVKGNKVEDTNGNEISIGSDTHTLSIKNYAENDDRIKNCFFVKEDLVIRSLNINNTNKENLANISKVYNEAKNGNIESIACNTIEFNEKNNWNNRGVTYYMIYTSPNYGFQVFPISKLEE